jgi:hypothetical protein
MIELFFFLRIIKILIKFEPDLRLNYDDSLTLYNSDIL